MLVLSKLCVIVLGPQFQNVSIKCCFLAWCRAFSENYDCYPKIDTKIVYTNFCKLQVGFDQVKNQLAHFGGTTKMFNIF